MTIRVLYHFARQKNMSNVELVIPFLTGKVKNVPRKQNIVKGIRRYQRGRQKSLSQKTDKTPANKMK